MSRRFLTVVATILVLVAGVSLWSAWYFGLAFTNPTANGVPVDVPPGAVRTVATGLRAPWGLAFLPDGTALVTERDTARIMAVRADGTVTEVQRVDEARPAGEGGLLGIAVSPTYETDRWVYIYYTTEHDNRVARLHLGEPPQPILTGIPKGTNHNGGRIAFGPDGMLYVGTGDSGDRGRAQDRGDLAGKILRITPDGRPAPGNPFGTPVWSYGHRNVQGLAWDSAGQLFATEFGQNRYDELNRISPGANYGWPHVEGFGGEQNIYTNPVATWSPADASPSGMAILNDRVYVACLRGTKLYRINTDGTGAQVLFDGEFGRLRHVAVAPDGSLWILTSNRDGRGTPAAEDDRILRFTP